MTSSLKNNFSTAKNYEKLQNMDVMLSNHEILFLLSSKNPNAIIKTPKKLSLSIMQFLSLEKISLFLYQLARAVLPKITLLIFSHLSNVL